MLRWAKYLPHFRLPLRVNLVEVLVLLVTIVAGCVLIVWSKSTVLRELYALEVAQREQTRLQMENRALRLEWATLTSPRILEEAARKKFHLRHPRPEEIVRMP